MRNRPILFAAVAFSFLALLLGGIAYLLEGSLLPSGGEGEPKISVAHPRSMPIDASNSDRTLEAKTEAPAQSKQEIAELPASSEVLGSIEDVLSKYRSAADRGDGPAAHAIFLAIYECYMREVGGGGWSSGVDCSDYSAEHVALMDHYLVLSADAGVTSAQLTYFGVGARNYNTAADISADLEGFKTYKERASRFLRQAAQSGSLDGMVTYANALEQGIIVSADIPQAYAYWYAARLSGLSSSADGVISGLRSRITEQQATDAERLARELASRCCSR